MKTDHELLELAARAMGITLIPFEVMPLIDTDGQPYWNPLIDDGAALRLAVKLRMTVRPGYVVTEERGGFDMGVLRTKQDPMGATRRAIVRAAAAIGEAM